MSTKSEIAIQFLKNDDVFLPVVAYPGTVHVSRRCPNQVLKDYSRILFKSPYKIFIIK